MNLRPNGEAGAHMLEGYSVAELEIVRRFLEDATALQRRMTERLLQEETKGLRRDRPE